MAKAKHTEKREYAGLELSLIPSLKSEDAEFFKYFNAIHKCRKNWEPADTPAVIRLCQQYVLRDEIRQEICDGEKLLETGRGGESGRTSYVKNPLLSTLTAMNADILAMEKELLLTPKARRVSGTKKQNKENAFFALQEEKAKRANSSLAN